MTQRGNVLDIDSHILIESGARGVGEGSTETRSRIVMHPRPESDGGRACHIKKEVF